MNAGGYDLVSSDDTEAFSSFQSDSDKDSFHWETRLHCIRHRPNNVPIMKKLLNTILMVCYLIRLNATHYRDFMASKKREAFRIGSDFAV